ncbi:MAG: hypothetical protein QF481_09040 [Acidimicrobiales bacterium]|nr:hypothetical protein [Acidimicrobiales bacterium]
MGLDATVAPGEAGMEPGSVEARIEGLGSELVEGWKGAVVAVRNDRNATESSYVTEHQVAAVVKAPAGPAVGVGVGRGHDVETAGHAQVDDEFTPAAPVGEQIGQEVLAAPPYRPDGVTHGIRGLVELRRGMGVAVDDAGSDEERFELHTHGLDLGEFGHPVTVSIGGAWVFCHRSGSVRLLPCRWSRS